MQRRMQLQPKTPPLSSYGSSLLRSDRKPGEKGLSRSKMASPLQSGLSQRLPASFHTSCIFICHDPNGCRLRRHIPGGIQYTHAGNGGNINPTHTPSSTCSAARRPKQEASPFFRLVSSRYQGGSTIITTNKAVRDRPEVLAGDDVMATTRGAPAFVGGSRRSFYQLIESNHYYCYSFKIPGWMSADLDFFNPFNGLGDFFYFAGHAVFAVFTDM